MSGITEVDEALSEAATYGRFATGALPSILGAANHQTVTPKADEMTSIAHGTAGWAEIRPKIRPVFEAVATDDL